MTGRAIRTKDWTYCIADPTGTTDKPTSTNYHEYQLYDQRNDPHELVNLAGRKEYRETADGLREQLKEVMAAAGEDGAGDRAGEAVPVRHFSLRCSLCRQFSGRRFHAEIGASVYWLR